MEAFWEDLRGDVPWAIDPQLESIRQVVPHALRNWGEVREAIEYFFNYGPEQCGYTGTTLFEAAKSDIVTHPDSCINFITAFVNSFNDIGSYDRETRTDHLQLFWSYADKMQEILSEMRPGFRDDQKFGDYFRKVPKR